MIQLRTLFKKILQIYVKEQFYMSDSNSKLLLSLMFKKQNLNS